MKRVAFWCWLVLILVGGLVAAGLVSLPNDHSAALVVATNLNVGSGQIFCQGKEAYLLTASHVVGEQGAAVYWRGGWHLAEMVAADQRLDAALLRVRSLDGASEVMPLHFARRPAFDAPLQSPGWVDLKPTRIRLRASGPLGRYYVMRGQGRPGQSGAPVCDEAGHLVTIVTRGRLADSLVVGPHPARLREWIRGALDD